MKNIHLQKTDKPSKIGQSVFNKSLHFNSIFNYELEKERVIPQHIYITNDEEIKEGWHFNNGIGVNHPVFVKSEYIKDLKDIYGEKPSHLAKIILTTDQDLIADGVQAIDDEFLEWFVKNPSCEWVEVQKWSSLAECGYSYHIIIPKEQCTCKIGQPYNNACCKVHGNIPKEEPKETLEEAAEKEFPLMDTEWCRTGACEEENFQLLGHRRSFKKGAEWQAERMYSEEDMKQAFKNGSWVASWSDMGIEMKYDNFETWFKTYKKK